MRVEERCGGRALTSQGEIQRVHRQWLLALGLAACIFSNTDDQVIAATPTANSNQADGSIPARGLSQSADIDGFKRFISSPPPIQELVFRQKTAPKPDTAKPKDGSFAASTNYLFFQARYEPPTIVLKKEHTLSNLLSERLSGGLLAILGKEYWWIDQERKQAHLWTMPEGARPNAPGQSVRRTVNYRLHPLFEVMNFGVQHAGIGTIAWNDNAFETETTNEEFGLKIKIRGSLESDYGGRPKSLRINYLMRGRQIGSFDYIVRYAFESQLTPAFLPNRITSYLLRDGKEIELDDFTILKLRIGSPTDSYAAFSMPPIISANQIPITVHITTSPVQGQTGHTGTLQQLCTCLAKYVDPCSGQQRSLPDTPTSVTERWPDPASNSCS